MGLTIDQMGGQTGTPQAQGNGGKMPGWAYALPVISQVLGSLGGSFGANQQAKLQKRQLDMQERQQQWGQQMDTTNMQRQLDADAYARANQNMTNPARIQVANALMQRMGLGQAFQEQKQGPVGPMVVQQANNPLLDRQNADIKRALEMVSAVRPDGSHVYKGSTRNWAQKEILDRYGIDPRQAPGAAQAWNKMNPQRPVTPWTPQNHVPFGQG